MPCLLHLRLERNSDLILGEKGNHCEFLIKEFTNTNSIGYNFETVLEESQLGNLFNKNTDIAK